MPIINQIVSGGGPAEPYRELEVSGVILQPNRTTTRMIPLTGVTSVYKYVLAYAYYFNTGISGPVDLSNLHMVGESSFNGTFFGCPNITSADISGVTEVSTTQYNAFRNAFEDSGITSINMSGLTTVSGSSVCYRVCADCLSLTTINYSGLTTVTGGNAFYEGFEGDTALTAVAMDNLTSVTSGSDCFYRTFHLCTNIVTASMKKLTTITSTRGFMGTFEGCSSLITFKFCSLSRVDAMNTMQNMFKGCTSLESLWFYALGSNAFGNTWTNQLSGLLSGCSNVTVHFTMAAQSNIGSWTSVTGGLGGTNTTVLFDIVTSLTGADTNTYTRSEKDSTSTATAWKYNDTLYYTSGVSNNTAGANEPSVGDTIYSDDACTTAVTTVSAIA